MSCAAIMTRNPPTLRDNESVAEAAAKLVAAHHTSLPVVDSKGRYAGMFGIDDLLGLIVPRVALAGNMMSNLRFIGDDPNALRRKFGEVKGRPVVDAARRNAPTVAPDTPEIEAIRLLCRSSSACVAVVDQHSGLVVGTVSASDVVGGIIGGPQERPEDGNRDGRARSGTSGSAA